MPDETNERRTTRAEKKTHSATLFWRGRRAINFRNTLACVFVLEALCHELNSLCGFGTLICETCFWHRYAAGSFIFV